MTDPQERAWDEAIAAQFRAQQDSRSRWALALVATLWLAYVAWVLIGLVAR
jgi:hypothetical protein